MPEERLAHLRGILGGSPTQEAWQALLQLLHNWPPEQGLETAVAYAEAHLEDWDDTLRSMDLQLLNQPFRSLARTLHSPWCPDEALRIFLDSSKDLPLFVMHISLSSETLPAFLRCAYLKQLHTLKLQHCDLHVHEWEQLASALQVAPLRTLSIERSTLKEESVQCLCQAPFFEQIQHLSLRDNYLDDPALEILASQSACHSLLSLDVGMNMFSDTGLCALSQSPYFQSLEILQLDPPPGESIGAKGLLSLLYSPYFPSLQRLICECHAFIDEVEELDEPDEEDEFSEFQCWGNLRFSNGWLTALRSQSEASSVRTLDMLSLVDVVINQRVLEAILQAPRCRAIRGLCLVGSPLGNDGLATIAQTPHMHDLEYLDMSGCAIGDSGLLALALSNQLPSIKHLELRNNAIGIRESSMSQEALLAFVRSPFFPELERLDLVGNDLTEQTIFAFLQSSNLSALRTVLVSFDCWGDESATYAKTAYARTVVRVMLPSFAE